jgi:hypothetical protein
VIDLVLWSFVIALTPVALGLTGALISRLVDWAALGSTQAFEEPDGWGRRSTANLHLSSVSVSMTGRVPSPNAGRS